MACMTLIKSTKPATLGKRYTLDAEGNIRKSVVANISEGVMQAFFITGSEQLAKLLKRVSEARDIALMSGRITGAEEREKINLVPEEELGRLLGCTKERVPGGVQIINGEKYAARVKRGIETSAWVLIDADNPEGITPEWAAMSLDERLKALEPAIPGLPTCTRVEYRSSSSRVLKDGQAPGGATHALIQISDPAKLEILREHLKVQTRLGGLSFSSPRRDRQTGAVISWGAKTLIDLSVWAPGRLVFCSKPEVFIEGYSVADAGVSIVNPAGGPLDVSWIDVPSQADLDELRKRTGEVLSFSRTGASLAVRDESSLRWSTPIEVKGTSRTLRELVAEIPPGGKLRCETPFRASQSEAAFIRIMDDGFPMLHDVGTSTSYYLPLDERLFLNGDVASIDLRQVETRFATMQTSGQIASQPVVHPLGQSAQQKPSLKDLIMDPARITRDRKLPVANVANIATVLTESHEWDSIFAYDEMADEIVVLRPLPGARTPHKSFRPHRLRDQDIIQTVVSIQRSGFRNAAKQSVADAIAQAANENIISPVRHYLEELERTVQWSPTTHTRLIHRLCTEYLGALEDAEAPSSHPKYLAEVGRRFMVAAVARALTPGCKVDTMLVLEGPQGKGKSSAAEVLFGKPYFSDNLPTVGTKDSSDHIRGKWCIEIPELSAMTKADVESIKAFITRTTDRFRRAYDRQETVYDRRCVFIGTTNKDAYLRDETGNRRFWPVRVGKINLVGLQRDRDLLWAEAVYWYRQGKKWYMPSSLQTLVEAAQESRVSRDIWQEVLASELEGKTEISLAEVARMVGLEQARVGRPEQNRLTAALRALGFEANGRFTSGQNRNMTRYKRVPVPSK